jgi:cholesterol transport system auxiliary component
MIRTLRRRRSVLVAGGVLVLLAGCGGLLPKPPERQLYRLTAAADLRGRVPQVGALLLVATPSAPAAIDTKRIALERSALSLDYYADGEWVDRPPFLLKAALIDAFERSRAFSGVSSEGLGLNADLVLNVELREFAAIYDSPAGPPRARVRVDAELVTLKGRSILAETSFTRDAAAAGNDLPAIVLAFDQATAAAVADLVMWTANIRLPRRRADR